MVFSIILFVDFSFTCAIMDSDSTFLIKHFHRTGRALSMKTYGDTMMQRTIIGMCRVRFWYFFFIISFSWLLFLHLFKTSMMVDKNIKVSLSGENHASFVDNQHFLSVDHLQEISHDHMRTLTNDHEKEPTNTNTKHLSSPVESLTIRTSDWVKIADEVLASEKESLYDDEIRSLFRRASGKKIRKKSYRTVATKRKRVKPVRSDIASQTQEITAKQVAKEPERRNEEEVGLDFESCKGRFIYVHRLPRRFNEDLLRHCESLTDWYNMCEFISNKGLGPHLLNSDKIYSNTGWFATNQFLLEVIFHYRMKQYRCLTSNSSLASAIFVPYYPGLDLNRYLWSKSLMKMKDVDALELVKWLRRKPEWKRMQGRDHFLVAGRISWDFLRESDRESAWGNKLLLLPQSRNMTMLVIESNPWNNNDFAIPYPTYFHPSNDNEVFQWQDRMRKQQRPFLFSFAGGPRPDVQHSIRNEVIDQCRASRKCRLLECAGKLNRCNEPVYVMKMFQSSVFCLQPAGDSYTRRSTFDSILGGCIPVFFHPGSAYVQYLWHLPKDHNKYSVFIPDIKVKHGKISIERILDKIANEKVLAMREQVIRLIPRVIYADPNSRLETLEDAFDITVNGVLDRVESSKRGISEGKNLSSDLAERAAWKYNLFGTVGKHEWDPFFVRPE